MLEWVEKALLSLNCLLVLQHFFADVIDESQFVDIDLNLVFVILQLTKDADGHTNLHLVILEPVSILVLAAALS